MPATSLLLKRFAAFTVMVSCLMANPLVADDNKRGELIKLDELGEPPAAIAKLIKQGSVKMYVGPPPRFVSRPNLVPANRDRLAAETHYKMSFNYRSRQRWRVENQSGIRKLVVTISFGRVNILTSHEIWFKRWPPEWKFWRDRLVLHEFDHVRISSDPTIEKNFVDKLRKESTFTREIGSGVRVTDSIVREYVKEHADKIFNDTIDLVGIRYRELDRVTDYGKKPIPKDADILP